MEEVVALLGDQVLGGRQVGLVDVEAVVQRRALGVREAVGRFAGLELGAVVGEVRSVDLLAPDYRDVGLAGGRDHVVDA